MPSIAELRASGVRIQPGEAIAIVQQLIGALDAKREMQGPSSPSTRDVRTMHAWCSAFGKPLLCLIAGPQGLHGYRFDDNESEGVPLQMVEAFPRGVVIGVEADGK